MTIGHNSMNRHVLHPLSVLVGTILLAAALTAHADKPTDRAALEGVGTGKVVWDINIGDPKKLSLYLKVIQIG